MKRIFSTLVLSALVLTGCTGSLSDFSEPAPSFDTLTIAYAEPISSYSPFSYNVTNRKYLANVYEPLLRYDATFNIESSLAISWGRLNDTTWDLRLREGVRFHTGEDFDADDVLYSISLSKSEGDSELGALLSNISMIEKTGDYRVSIHTAVPDPLLLNKLTLVYMVPSEYTNFEIPIGTGAYRVTAFSENHLDLERFEEYWGSAAFFPKLRLSYIPDFNERRELFLNDEIHVLANVPPQYLEELRDDEHVFVEFPSLEVSFLMMNRSGQLANSNLRSAIWYALSDDFAESFGGGFLENTSQYAATGIFGYSSDFEEREQNLQFAKEFRDLVPGDVTLVLDLPLGLELLGEAIAKDLAEIDVTVEWEALNALDLEKKIQSGQSDFYFFGWKYDLADSADFFESVVHTPESGYGSFNGLSYSDPDLDSWIEETSTHFSEKERRALLKAISQRLLDDKSIVPLFESKTLYGFQKGLFWRVRLDGQLWASEIIENVVE